MKAARELLLTLSTVCPPSGKARHALTLDDLGRLRLNIAGNDGWRGISFEPEDLEKDPHQAAREILLLIQHLAVPVGDALPRDTSQGLVPVRKRLEAVQRRLEGAMQALTALEQDPSQGRAQIAYVLLSELGIRISDLYDRATARPGTPEPSKLPPILPGWYFNTKMEGQPPICVTDTGGPPNGESHGPWITYHLEGEHPDNAQPVLWQTFHALMEIGYTHEKEVAAAINPSNPAMKYTEVSWEPGHPLTKDSALGKALLEALGDKPEG